MRPDPLKLRIKTLLTLLLLGLLGVHALAPLAGVHIAYADDAWHAFSGSSLIILVNKGEKKSYDWAYVERPALVNLRAQK